MIKRLSAILFALIFLTSCGKVISNENGVYTCKQLIKDGKKLTVSEYYSAPPVLTLSDGNKAVLEISGESCECTWENNNGDFALFTGEKTSRGTIKDGVCTVDLFDQGISYGFYSEAASLPDWEGKEEKREKNNRWSGAWYGYWGMKNAFGEWENLDGQYFDCFAVIDMAINNFGEITLWDENSSMSAPIAAVKLNLAPSSTGFGAAKSESGYFLSCDITKGEWKIEPDREELENVISFSSHYSGNDGEFDYYIFLRPWGYVWDDAVENEYIRLPYYYNQWYIPMLSNNYSMPESFEP